MAKGSCSVSGCERPHLARGLCGTHYARLRNHGSPDVVSVVLGDPMANMAAHIDPVDNGCWEWTGSRDADGYGSLRDRYRTLRAHRVVYEYVIGPIPEGLTIDHLCRNRGCVNPAHLEPVTVRTNILRGDGLGAQAARRDSCARGHQYTTESTYVWRGRRLCRTCDRARGATYYQAHKVEDWLKAEIRAKVRELEDEA